MSKKSYDYIDHKIKEAADNSMPAFDENAWHNMDKLLDKEAKKKRFFIWWRIILPAILILLGFAAFVFIKNNKASNTLATVVQKNVITTNKSLPASVGKQPNFPILINTNKEDVVLQQQSTFADQFFGYRSNRLIVDKKFDELLEHKTTLPPKKLSEFKKGKVTMIISSSVVEETKQIALHKLEQDNIKLEVLPLETDSFAQKIDVLQNLKIDSNSLDTNLNYTILKPDSTNKKIAQPNNNKSVSRSIKSRFYFLASAGVEITGVKPGKFANSQRTIRFGFGIGYQINKKISLQTGIYAGKKDYEAGPGDYAIKPGSYWSMVRLNKVTGSCYVYDIPVAVRVNLVQRKWFNVYTLGTVSSYIMKKEDYKYYYWSQNQQNSKQYSYAGNRHLFAEFSFAAGIEQKLSSTFSLQAEPYFSIPLSGVGEGKVKLFSVGIQFGIKYTPSPKH